MDPISFVQVVSAYVFTVTIDDFTVTYLELPFPSRMQVFKRREDDVAKLLHVASVYLVNTTYPVMIVDGESGDVALLLGATDGAIEIIPSYVHFVYPRLSNSEGGTHTFRVFKFVV